MATLYSAGKLLSPDRSRNPRRARQALVIFFVLTIPLAAASCRRSGETGSQNAGANANAPASTGGTSAVPPFETREPERYQAVRVESVSDGAETSSRETFVARDGERRREDYETAGGRVSYLQRPDGVYVLLPGRKLYSELKPGEGAEAAPSASVPPDFSPEKLLGASRPEARYEKLGPDEVNGRATQKYRVTLEGRTGAGREVITESFVWVDEALGMPVKSEMTVTASGGAKMMTELREIKETVDAGLFELPADYRKVDFRELAAQIARADCPGQVRLGPRHREAPGRPTSRGVSGIRTWRAPLSPDVETRRAAEFIGLLVVGSLRT
jgi:hypothetical protein